MNMNNDKCTKRIFSWKATLIGSLIAFGLMFLFTLLTIGGGLSSYVTTEKGLDTLVVLAYLWLAIGSFLILFLAGMVTSMLVSHDGCVSGSHHSILHGFVTWVFYILISLTFLSHLSDSIVTFPRNFFAISSTIDNVSSSVSERISENRETARQNTKTQEQKAAHKLGIATLASFFIFGLEALGACFGAWCGMDICRRHCPPKNN
ncbi:MAG: hypothetical protein JSS07_06280 [Proteobacteria bacterium]|nr:hypothetical protein [Pseudomonadota bacterium]